MSMSDLISSLESLQAELAAQGLELVLETSPVLVELERGEVTSTVRASRSQRLRVRTLDTGAGDRHDRSPMGTHTDFDAVRADSPDRYDRHRGLDAFPAHTTMSVAPALDQTTTVDGALEHVDVALGVVVDRLDLLEHRLSSVLGPAAPELAEAQLRAPEALKAPLVDALNARSARLETVADRLQSIIARLAL